jgi:hypothetical protein
MLRNLRKPRRMRMTASSFVSNFATDRRSAHLTNARSHLDVLHTRALSNPYGLGILPMATLWALLR